MLLLLLLLKALLLLPGLRGAERARARHVVHQLELLLHCQPMTRDVSTTDKGDPPAEQKAATAKLHSLQE